MRSWCVALLACFAFSTVSPVSAQSTASQATNLLAQSLQAQTGGLATSDLTLKGTASFPHSAQTGTYSVVLTALSNGTSEVDTQLPAGTVKQIWNNSGSVPLLTVTAASGTIATQQPGQNTFMPTGAWFSPAILTALMSRSGYSVSDAGALTLNGSSLQHLVVMPSAKTETQSDIYLDSGTTLPVLTIVQVNPTYAPGASKPTTAHAALVPEEIRFSNYQVVQGREIPLHIQVYLGTVRLEILDISVSSALVNSGATVATPSVSAN